MTSPAATGKTTTVHVALLGGLDRKGRWEVRPRTVAVAAVGGIDLDLTEAALPGGDVTVVKVSLVGGATLRVPADVNVVVEGFNLVGRRSDDVVSTAPGAPTVRLLAYGLWGGVRVERAG